MFPHLQKFSLQKWINENRADWGQRRVIWQDSDFIAFVTRGPNRRKDFHINPGDEIFYQLEGELKLHYLKDNKQNIAVLQPGDILLLPKNTPHSPRRGDGSWTYVVERQRGKDELDRFIWPCENCGQQLYATDVHFGDPGDAVGKATAALRSDPNLAKCKECGAVLEL